MNKKQIEILKQILTVTMKSDMDQEKQLQIIALIGEMIKEHEKNNY